MNMQYQKDAVIFREGDEANCMYEVVRGRVGIYALYGTDYAELLDEVGEHGTYGEIGLIDAVPRSATAVALEDTELREIGIGEIRSYFLNNPDKLLEIMRYLGSRIRKLTQDYDELRESLRESAKAFMQPEKKQKRYWKRLFRSSGIYQKNRKLERMLHTADTSDYANHSEGFAKEVRAYRKGEIVFREGDESTCMYDIHRGRVGIYLNYGTEREMLLSTLSVNRFFGEMGMLQNLPRSATAVVLENDTHLELIAPGDINELLEKNPSKVEMIIRHLSFRLRSLTHDYMDACHAAEELTEAEQSGGLISEETKARIRRHVSE